MPRIGYWNAYTAYSDSYLADEITANGFEAVSLNGITAAELASLDALYLVNDNGGWNMSASETAALDAAVNGGMGLVVFDRSAEGSDGTIPGLDGATIVSQYDVDVNVAATAPATFVTANGTINDDTLDGGDWSHHGYADSDTLPNGATVLLTTANASEAVAFSYNFGEGTVFYATVPIDYYSGISDLAITTTEVATLVGNALSHVLELGPIEFDHATTTELFASRGGKVAFLSELALAAYHLDTEGDHEIEGDFINDFKQPGEDAYAGLPDGLELLDADDLPGLALQPSGPAGFFQEGIANGIFTTANSAALVARSEDAMFVAFRGTNDTDAGILDAPDAGQWLPATMPRHFANFDLLFDEIRTYLVQNPEIKVLYFAGHSLGGAMVEAVMRDAAAEFPTVSVSAVTFASPGYPGDAQDRPEFQHANYKIAGDFVPWSNNVLDNDSSGDITKIKHNLKDQTDGTRPDPVDGEVQELRTVGGTDLHSMRLYNDFITFFASQGVFNTYQNDIDYDTIIAHGTAVNIDAQEYKIGTADDDITGGFRWEIILAAVAMTPSMRDVAMTLSKAVPTTI